MFHLDRGSVRSSGGLFISMEHCNAVQNRAERWRFAQTTNPLLCVRAGNIAAQRLISSRWAFSCVFAKHKANTAARLPVHVNTVTRSRTVFPHSMARSRKAGTRHETSTILNSLLALASLSHVYLCLAFPFVLLFAPTHSSQRSSHEGAPSHLILPRAQLSLSATLYHTAFCCSSADIKKTSPYILLNGGSVSHAIPHVKHCAVFSL